MKSGNLDPIWYPFSWKDATPPLIAASASGSQIIDVDGQAYIDAISSWWVNVHGHGHTHITEKIKECLDKLHHVIFANFSHQPAIDLAARILKRLPNKQKKIFFSDNGSTAVEVGIKMALQYWYNEGRPRRKIIALSNSYHGDTFGSMAASSRGPFVRPFEDLLFEVQFIDLRPESPKHSLLQLEELLDTGEFAAFIYEPLVQGAGGMLMHDPDQLEPLLAMCREHGVLTIADEVMTGFGRTGTFFASEQLTTKPDIICLSKGLTGGTLPLGVTSCTREIWERFWVDDRSKAFFHGHSFTANPLACTAALASLDLFDLGSWQKAVKSIEAQNRNFIDTTKGTSVVSQPRIRGSILAFDLNITGSRKGYITSFRDRVINFCLKEGVLLRPLGTTLYIMPPYCVTENEMQTIYGCIEKLLIKLPSLT